MAYSSTADYYYYYLDGTGRLNTPEDCVAISELFETEDTGALIN